MRLHAVCVLKTSMLTTGGLRVQAGMIVDDELNRLLVNPLPPGVRLHAIIDACHSGTALDLEYRCKVKSSGIHWKNEYTHRPSVYKVSFTWPPPVVACKCGCVTK